MGILMYTLLQTQAAAQNGSQSAQGGSQWSFWIMIILIFVVMWLFMIRPQRKQQKELEKFRSGLKKGDKVITAGGIYGTVSSIDERTVTIQVDKDVTLKVDKSSIVRDSSKAQ